MHVNFHMLVANESSAKEVLIVCMWWVKIELKVNDYVIYYMKIP